MGLIEAPAPKAVWRQRTSSSFTPAEAVQKKKKPRASISVCDREQEMGRGAMSSHQLKDTVKLIEQRMDLIILLWRLPLTTLYQRDNVTLHFHNSLCSTSLEQSSAIILSLNSAPSVCV